MVAKKIKAKINMNLGTMANYTRMVQNLAYTHNQMWLQQRLADVRDEGKAKEISEQIFNANVEETKEGLQHNLAVAMANRFTHQGRPSQALPNLRRDTSEDASHSAIDVPNSGRDRSE